MFGFISSLFVLALAATVVGELSFGAVYAFNRRYYGDMSREMMTNHNLAVHALARQDKESYKACNGLANDAFGKSFFSHIALFASSLWPAPFVLGWLDFRFGQEIFQLPLIGAVGPAFAFIPVYILTRVAFSRVRSRLPLFRRIKQMIEETETPKTLLHYTDIPRMVKRGSSESSDWGVVYPSVAKVEDAVDARREG